MSDEAIYSTKEDKYIKCDERDPNRCKGVMKDGQCIYLAMEHSAFCNLHGGPAGQKAAVKKQYHDYLIQQYQTRLDDFAGSDNIKNLHGEIGLLRMIIENIVNQIKTPEHFPLYADKIGGLIDKCHKIVVDMQKLDEKTGQMMSKDAMFTLIDSIATIIGKYITDSDTLNTLSSEIGDAILTVGSGTTIKKFTQS